MALPTLAAPALLGLETPENLCPCDLSLNGSHQHCPHPPAAAGRGDADLGLCVTLPSPMPGAWARFTAEASGTVHLV